MAHFAEIDENNLVIRVLRIPDTQEHRGEEYLSEDLGLGGRWIQGSYNNNIRKQFPSKGFSYDENADVFIRPNTAPSWKLDENFDWQPPVPRPKDYATTHQEGTKYYWDEDNLSWEVSPE